MRAILDLRILNESAWKHDFWRMMACDERATSKPQLWRWRTIMLKIIAIIIGSFNETIKASTMINKKYQLPIVAFAIIILIFLVRILLDRKEMQTAFGSLRSRTQIKNLLSIDPELLKYNGSGAYPS